MSVCAPSLPHPALNSSLTRAKEEFYPGPSDERHQTILLSYQRTSPVSSHFVCCPFRVFSITWLTASDASPHSVIVLSHFIQIAYEPHKGDEAFYGCSRTPLKPGGAGAGATALRLRALAGITEAPRPVPSTAGACSLRKSDAGLASAGTRTRDPHLQTHKNVSKLGSAVLSPPRLRYHLRSLTLRSVKAPRPGAGPQRGLEGSLTSL